MKNYIAYLILIAASVCLAEDIEDLILGEWAITAGGQTTSILEFKEDGTVINKSADGAGSYRFLEDSRIMIEFPDGILLGTLKPMDGKIFLTGTFSASQPISLSLSEVTSEKEQEALANIKKTQTQLETYLEGMEKMEEVRRRSQDMTIRNNLRQLLAAAMQYMLETGESEVMTDQLIGEDSFIPSLDPVNGESYMGITITDDDATLSVTDADGKTHSLSY